MQVQFVGCGDAFGSGGRFNTCFHVQGAACNFLIDCGASSLVALKRCGIDRNAIDLILVTHFHADHFGGVPFFVLDAQFFSKRTRPLTIAGPAGLPDWYHRVMETAFPGSSGTRQKFELALAELAPGRPWFFGGIEVLPAQADHGPPGGPFHAYRVTMEGKTIAYTGDTAWTDDLVTIGRNADLLVAETYFYQREVPWHLSYRRLAENLPAIGAKRVILTHMNDDMLAHAADVPETAASDGLVVRF